MEVTTSLLRAIEKPGRYFAPFYSRHQGEFTGNEPKILIVFPDLFEVAHSHTGIKILYHLFRKHGAFVDFGFAFRQDIEPALRRDGKLISFMHGIDYRDFDLICVSFQYQLHFPTLLRMLTVAGIPVEKSARGKDMPIIAGGGPAMINPEPMLDFLDYAFIGEVEPVARDIVEVLKASSGRAERLSGFGETSGFYDGTKPVKRSIAADLDEPGIVPSDMPVFGLRTVHDRYIIEIQRGCTRGCRFCMAGFLYRPHRERSASEIVRNLSDNAHVCGCSEASFLSLSAGDHSQIKELLEYSYSDAERGFSVSLPSLRPETLTDDIVRLVSKGRKGGFTLAPESGSERLRNLINKGNTKEDLYDAVRRVFTGGWRSVKLYFMLGLPTENDEDIKETIALVFEICSIARRFGKKTMVTASFSTFVPQPFTPFQWEAMLSESEIDRRQKMIREGLSRIGNLKLDWHDRRVSLTEGMLSRADRRFGKVIKNVAEKMIDLQSWDDTFNYSMWLDSMREADLSVEEAIGARDTTVPLPYSKIDIGVTNEFLLKEREKAYKFELTPECASGNCGDCGVCDHKLIKPHLKSQTDKTAPASSTKAGHSDSTSFNRGNAWPYIFTFAKRGRATSIGHLDLVDFIIKGMISSGLNLLYSEGFHPMPRFNLANPLPVGVESDADAGFIWFTQRLTEKEILDKMNYIFKGSGLEFLRFRLLDPDEVKPFEKAARTVERIPYTARFENAADADRFVQVEALENIIRTELTVNFIHSLSKGSVMNFFEGIEGGFHLVRNKYLSF